MRIKRGQEYIISAAKLSINLFDKVRIQTAFGKKSRYVRLKAKA